MLIGTMHYREVRSGETAAATRQNQVPHTRPCDRRGTGQDYQVIQFFLKHETTTAQWKGK